MRWREAGGFLIFPALIFSGVPPIAANASTTLAVFPAAFASALGYRRELRALHNEVPFKMLIVISLLGGIAGAYLLLSTPETVFVAMVPWLLLFATTIFIFGKQIAALVSRYTRFGLISLIIVQLVIALYGGYFGGGIGIMMLAALSLYGMSNINSMNAVKTVLSGTMNGVAVIIFIINGAVWWPQALVMMVAAVVGGYGGAALGRRVDPRILRGFVASAGLLLSFLLFLF